jgi:polysaccharide export outer membrane protein
MKGYVRYGALFLLPLLAISAAPQESSSKKGEESKEPRVATAREATRDVRKPVAATNDPNYVIGPEDVLDINVWKEPDISRTVPVRPDGKISLPLLNDIQAVGLTPRQLGLVVTESLKKFLTEPQVTVIVTAINSRRVYILGEVNRPGAFALLPGLTVLQALSSAGGFTPYANPKKIYVLRSENGKQAKYPFNYKEVIAGAQTNQNIQLQPGDTIVVP